jgi:LysM repeat protein
MKDWQQQAGDIGVLQRLQAQIERIPSGVRRIIIAIVAIAVLAFFFPLRDDDRRRSDDPLLQDINGTLIPAATITQIVNETRAAEEEAEEAVTRTPTPRPQPTITPTLCAINAEWTDIYTVRRGDTLDGISRLVQASVTELVEGNCLLNANRLDVGQELRVPALPSLLITPTNTPTATFTPSPTPRATATAGG